MYTTSRNGSKDTCAEFDAIHVAILGNELICEHPANVPSATGAQASVVIGTLTPA